MILIIAEETDWHALSVARSIYEIDPFANVAIVDAQDFPARCRLDLRLESWSMKMADGRTIVF
jgi:hypothetical protein